MKTLDELERAAYCMSTAAAAFIRRIEEEATDGTLDAKEAAELQETLDYMRVRLGLLESRLQAAVDALREARYLRMPEAAALAAVLDRLLGAAVEEAPTVRDIERACGLRR